MKKMAIIGSGLSGLTLAHLLKDCFEITLFEKARSPGGRLATRRTDPYA
jgi:renalase